MFAIVCIAVIVPIALITVIAVIALIDHFKLEIKDKNIKYKIFNNINNKQV